MSHNIKVYHFIDSLGQGGAEQLLLNLTPTLARTGVASEVICISPPETLAQDLLDQNIPVHRFKISHRWNILEGLIKILFLPRPQKHDYLQGHLFFGTLYASIAHLIFPSCKMLVSLHSFEFDRDLPDTIWHKFRLILRKYLLRRRKVHCIAVTQAVKEHYTHHLGITEIEVIPNALPAEIFAIERSTRSDRTMDDFKIIVPARLIPEKGHSVYLEALKILIERGMKPHTFFYGEGPLLHSLKLIAKDNHLDEMIQWCGRVPNSELLQAYADADLTVLPSLSEGFGYAAAEAMAIGCPVIASATGGLKELIDHQKTGLLVPVGDAYALANAIQCVLLKQIDTEPLIRSGREAMETKFGLTQVTQQWLRFYEEKNEL